MSSVLVTGARGFAGGYRANLLAESGASVVGWMRPAGQVPTDPFFHPSIVWQEVDLLDPGSVARAISETRPGAV